MSSGNGRHCRVGAVLGHREWIAYLLHHCFSSHRGGLGEWMQGPGGRLPTFWEQFLDLYTLALWTDMQTDIYHVHLLGGEPKRLLFRWLIKVVAMATASAVEYYSQHFWSSYNNVSCVVEAVAVSVNCTETHLALPVAVSHQRHPNFH